MNYITEYHIYYTNYTRYFDNYSKSQDIIYIYIVSRLSLVGL